MTDIDTPWEADDLRDRPDQREQMFRAFENALIKYRRPYIKLSGSIKQRMEIATGAIDRILAGRKDLDTYSRELCRLNSYVSL